MSGHVRPVYVSLGHDRPGWDKYGQVRLVRFRTCYDRLGQYRTGWERLGQISFLLPG
jgi:hypothetical protein